MRLLTYLGVILSCFLLTLLIASGEYWKETAGLEGIAVIQPIRCTIHSQWEFSSHSLQPWGGSRQLVPYQSHVSRGSVHQRISYSKQSTSLQLGFCAKYPLPLLRKYCQMSMTSKLRELREQRKTALLVSGTWTLSNVNRSSWVEHKINASAAGLRPSVV